jgi:hypothetical protein
MGRPSRWFPGRGVERGHFRTPLAAFRQGDADLDERVAALNFDLR